MKPTPRHVQYPSPLEIICPTCRGANQSRVLFNVANCVKVILTMPLWIAFGTDFLLVRLKRCCDVCGARFVPKRWTWQPAEPKCWKCGYLLRGLTEPRCPECGTQFPPEVLGQQ